MKTHIKTPVLFLWCVSLKINIGTVLFPSIGMCWHFRQAPNITFAFWIGTFQLLHLNSFFGVFDVCFSQSYHKVATELNFWLDMTGRTFCQLPRHSKGRTLHMMNNYTYSKEHPCIKKMEMASDIYKKQLNSGEKSVWGEKGRESGTLSTSEMGKITRKFLLFHRKWDSGSLWSVSVCLSAWLNSCK